VIAEFSVENSLRNEGILDLDRFIDLGGLADVDERNGSIVNANIAACRGLYRIFVNDESTAACHARGLLFYFVTLRSEWNRVTLMYDYTCGLSQQSSLSQRKEIVLRNRK